MRLGVLANPGYAALEEVLALLGRAADTLGVDVVVAEDVRPGLSGDSDSDGLGSELDGIDILLTLGGDGTLLRGARIAGQRGFPVIGCNLGHLGFMTAVPVERLEEALGRLVSGDYTEERRLALEVVVRRTPAVEEGREEAARRHSTGDVQDTPGPYYALNDAVVHKTGFARLITLRVWVDDEEIGQYSADGIVLSTATGSTAYSLSAGGPILVPSLDAIVATPISPHTLAVRPVVVSASSAITVELLTRTEETLVTVDGQVGTHLSAGDRVRVARSPDPVRLIRMPDQNFFAVLRQKLRWGDVRPPRP
ncbi:MAG: NAD(+)/NADH kinase [Gemmatimonadota bacterium]